jgi:integrase
VGVAKRGSRPSGDLATSGLDPATEKAGLKGVRAHDLRHTCAALMYAEAPSPWRSVVGRETRR